MTTPICPKHGLPGRYAWGSMVICIREDEELQAERQSRTKTKEVPKFTKAELIVQPVPVGSIIGEKAIYNGKYIGIFATEPYQSGAGCWYAQVHHVTGHKWTVQLDPDDRKTVILA